MNTILICHHLLQLEIKFDVEYSVKFPKIKGQRKRGSRFDIVIIKDNNIIGIIETKGNSKSNSKNQMKRYALFGVPVFLCNDVNKIKDAVIFAKTL